MFYEAMLSGGESKNKAMLIYYAVVRFGPRWEVQATGIGSIESQRYRLVVYDTKLDEAEFAEVREQLDANTITLSDLERQASARRQGTEVVTSSETLAIPGRSIKCRPAEYGSRLRQEPGR
jgi:hypothetical protein